MYVEIAALDPEPHPPASFVESELELPSAYSGETDAAQRMTRFQRIWRLGATL
jgi:hypothetical protein